PYGPVRLGVASDVLAGPCDASPVTYPNATPTVRNEAARFSALESVRRTVRVFEDEDISALVPEVGMNVGIATPYALSQEEVAAVEGRITRTLDGVSANEGVWFGASGHIARFLLAVRDYDNDVKAACNVRNTGRILDVVNENFDTVEFDREDEPAGVSTMEWSANQAMEGRNGAPDALVDSGAVGKEAMIRLLAESPDELHEKVVEINRSVNE
ncbi:MAG: thiamine-phosphate synthase family protein, partial [Halobacteria archaeon]|nr:thiamine-phosphate synthase family protein [Halobacteria archaeon]